MSKAYIVRMQENAEYNGPRIVGMFVVENFAGLFSLVDQVCDPSETEATLVNYGGLILAAPDFQPELDEYAEIGARWRRLER